VRWLRDLLRHLAGEGKAVLVSSHQLAEVQLTCDAVAIVDRGRTVAAGPVDEVLRLGGSTGLLVRVDDLAHGTAALAAAGYEVTKTGAHLRVAAPATAGADVTRALASTGQWVSELRIEEVSLEDLFLEITGASPAAITEEVLA